MRPTNGCGVRFNHQVPQLFSPEPLAMVMAGIKRERYRLTAEGCD